MKNLIFMLLFLSLSMLSQAQNKQTVDIRIEMKYDTVGINEQFSITYHIGSTQNVQMAPPNFDNFLSLGSFQSSRTNIRNGERSSSTSFSYTLQPQSLGYHTIPSTEIFVDGEVYYSPEANIVVVESTDHPVSKSFGFQNMPSLGFNDDDLNKLFEQQEELMRPYQDMLNISPDLLLKDPNSILKDLELDQNFMQLFKNLEDAFEFKKSPLQKPKPKEKTYKL